MYKISFVCENKGQANRLRECVMGFFEKNEEERDVKENTKERKLYIWNKFEPYYDDGLAFSIAETEEEARKLVETEQGFRVGNWGEMEVRTLSKCARCISGGA